MLTRAQQLQDRAQKCRELADTAMTDEGRSILFEIAQRYEREASAVEAPSSRPAFSEVAA
ncbi:hypothetical protein [Sphingomonas alba]|uniref:Uncharacterized protein n=1 Tax=Sphingomonas alba TaxID=2908208 RepID=A0ABT0RM34_9SPHN|nr:hypothetical protein [Sphingomonas alba]MCL6683623.1 hypothetical protein [Sphingomonas alba]